MTINKTFETILNTSISAKKKNAEGKYDQYTTTALADNFKHCPKPKDCADPAAKSALVSLEKVYEYMEISGTSRTDNQRDKATNKAFDFAREYLKAVGLSTGIGNVVELCSIVAPKRQTTKGEVKGGYTTKTTFIKYALFLTNHYISTGSWTDPKKTAKTSKDEHSELWAEMQRNKEAYEAQKEELEMLRKFYAEHKAS